MSTDGLGSSGILGLQGQQQQQRTVQENSAMVEDKGQEDAVGAQPRSRRSDDGEEQRRQRHPVVPFDAARGVKRPRDEISNCDCDNVYIPLSKRINGLNIERDQDSRGGGQQQQQQQGLASFQESYPYSANSPYYASNHLLYHLHMERSQRHQQQQQERQHHQNS